MIRSASFLLAPAMLVAAAPALAQDQAADAPLLALVKDFIEAESQFDQARLATLITEDYVEVSPIGEVDARAEFLSFYATDKKRPAPATALSEPLVRRFGDTALILARLSFERPGAEGQPARTVSIRVGFLAVRSSGTWKLASAQYTPERPK